MVVFYDGTNYWLADGFHRVKATLIEERYEIECEVLQGTQEDAQWFSYAANKTNGLRRTNDDKQRAVKAALLHPKGAGSSDRQIAKHVGVHHDTVSEWRAKLQSTGGIRQSKKRIGRDGRTINTEKIGKGRRRKTSKAGASSPPQPASVPVEPAAQPAPQAPELTPESTAADTDKPDTTAIESAERIYKNCMEIEIFHQKSANPGAYQIEINHGT